MKDALVSVIIPVYNTEKYLDKCLESVINQTYKNLQIILVDDGATDSSPQLCDEWKVKDSRIEVIHKQNEGLGFTRNAGIKKAKGKYVCFLDSDDTIDSDTIHYCVYMLSNENVDACFYGRKTQKKDGVFYVNSNLPQKLVFEGDEIKQEFARIYIGQLPNENPTSYIQASACCGMYRLDIIKENNINFLSERVCLSEDTFFNLDFCKYAKKILIIPKDFYNYTYNGNSLTKSYNPNKINQTKNFIKCLEKCRDSFVHMEQVDKRIYYSFYIYFRHAFEYEVKAWKVNGLFQTYKRVRELCDDELLAEYARKVPLEILDSKKKMFVTLYLRKQALLILMYYMKK